MQLMIAGFSVAVLLLIILVYAIVQKSRRKKAKRKEEQALKGVMLGIGQRLYAVYPGSRWRWVCYPTGFAINGGIARIEVI